MKIKETVSLWVLVVIVLAGVFSVFTLQSRGKAKQGKMVADLDKRLIEQDKELAEQAKKLTEQAKKLTEQDRKLTEQDKKLAEQDKKLTEQNKKVAEVEETVEKVDGVQAEPKLRKSDTPAIGVVSIRKIFQDSQKAAGYRQEAMLEQEKIRAKWEKLARNIEAEEEGLKTLRINSDAYLAQHRKILQERANLQVEQESYKEQMALREQKMTSELYKDILRGTAEVAKQKGLDLVFEKSEPELPTLNPTQLELAIGLHKVLYSAGCQDITDEVMTWIDAEEKRKM